MVFTLIVMTCDLHRRNGQRGSSAEFAATSMNLTLRKRGFVIARIAARTMETVIFASSLTSRPFARCERQR